MGERDQDRRRPPTLRSGVVALALIGAGCSSSHSRVTGTGSTPLTEAPITAAPIRSLGQRLARGPQPPPTTSSLGRPLTTSAKGPQPAVGSAHDPATPDCPAVDLSVSAATDRPSYPDGLPVTIAVSVLNSGAGLCQFQANVVNGGASVQQSGGRPVWERARPAGAPPPPLYYRLTPRQPTVVASLAWDQRSCPPPCTGAEGSRPNPGSYRAVPQMSGVPSVRPAPFTLV